MGTKAKGGGGGGGNRCRNELRQRDETCIRADCNSASTRRAIGRKRDGRNVAADVKRLAWPCLKGIPRVPAMSSTTSPLLLPAVASACRATFITFHHVSNVTHNRRTPPTLSSLSFSFFFALFFRTFLCAGKYNRVHAGIQRYREIRILSLRSSISPLVGEFFFFLDRALHRVQLRFNHVEFRNIDNIFIRVYLIWKLRDKFIYIGLATK